MCRYWRYRNNPLQCASLSRHYDAAVRGTAMRRREFLVLVGGALALRPRIACAQSRKVPTVAYLWHAANAAEEEPYFSAIREGFAKLGSIIKAHSKSRVSKAQKQFIADVKNAGGVADIGYGLDDCLYVFAPPAQLSRPAAPTTPPTTRRSAPPAAPAPPLRSSATRRRAPRTCTAPSRTARPPAPPPVR